MWALIMAGSQHYTVWSNSNALSVPQLNDVLNATGDVLVFILNSLLKDCGCSNPNL